MSAPFRIQNNSIRDDNDPFKDYLSRLLKLIPAEIVGLYMIGSGFIPSDQHLGLLVWTFICLILVIIVRVYGTADKSNDLPAQKVPVFISTIAYVIWVYWLGGPFKV